MNQIPETQRLFFALWPDEAVRAALAARARALASRGGRLVVPENLHLTLAFLGSVDPTMRSCLERAADGIRCPGFALRLDQAGYFPRPQVCWLGASQPPAALSALVVELRRAQLQCGGDPEQRPFQAHLTLARRVRRRPPKSELPAVDWTIDRFVLVSSQTLPEGPVYRLERSWMLQAQ